MNVIMPDYLVTELKGYFRALQVLAGDEFARFFVDQIPISDTVDDTLQMYCTGGLVGEGSFHFNFKGFSEIEYVETTKLIDSFIFKKLRQKIDPDIVEQLKKILASYFEMVGISLGRQIPYDLSSQSSFYLIATDVKELEQSIHIAIKYKNDFVIVNAGYF